MLRHMNRRKSPARQRARSDARHCPKQRRSHGDQHKQRTRRFASEQRKQIAWCFAKDTFPAGTLAADPNLPGRKLEFLQCHDRECADLPGLVPLVVGLPVTLSEHVDREKGLLRGTMCTMVGWQVAADETALPSDLPEVAWIAKQDARCFRGGI